MKSSIVKKVLVLSGGTGTAWSICSSLKKIAKDETHLIVCDTNPAYLVHTSILADEFITVKPIASDGYYSSILSLCEHHCVDIIVPLIDFDLQIFARDNEDLISRNIFSTAPPRNVFNALSNKLNLWQTASALGVPTPDIYTAESLNNDTLYFVKPVIGFGSRNTNILSGSEIKKIDTSEYIIQELCLPEEITVDISVISNNVSCVCRERIETKAGVCTKAKVFYDPIIENQIKKIASQLALPECCCAQFMKNKDGEWCLTDFNLRLGAGSALSAAVGFTFADYAVSSWLGKPIIKPITDNEPHYVVRHYEEIITK